MKLLFTILIVGLGAAALHAKSNTDSSQKPDATKVAMAGLRLDADQAAELEAAIAKNPADLSARTKLLGYYFNSRYSAADAKAAQRKHVLWIIKNTPEAEIAGTPFCQIDAISD